MLRSRIATYCCTGRMVSSKQPNFALLPAAPISPFLPAAKGAHIILSNFMLSNLGINALDWDQCCLVLPRELQTQAVVVTHLVS